MEEVIKAVVPIVAEIEISYRSNVKPSMFPKISEPDDVYKLFIQTWDATKIEFVEQFRIMLLNSARKVLGICTLTSGTAGGTIIAPKLVFAIALKTAESEIIICDYLKLYIIRIIICRA